MWLIDHKLYTFDTVNYW